MIKAVIYKYTCIPTGKVYIGQTYRESERKRRFYKFTQPYSGRKINEARAEFNKRSDWDYEILESKEFSDIEFAQAKQYLNKKETHYINQFNSVSEGYNIDEGGTNRKTYISSKDRINWDMLYDMSHLDYDHFMTRYRWQFNYSYDNSNPNGWIRFGETEIYYQFVGEDYFELYWNVNRVQDGQKRRKKVYERMCLRKLMNPEISLDTLMFCAYEDIHRFFDNSDNVLNPDYILRNATNAYKMELTEIESKYSDNISYLRQTSNPKDHIILKSGSAAGGQANLVKSEIKFSLIDGIYNPSLSVAENRAIIERDLFPICERTLYYYCKERGISYRLTDDDIKDLLDFSLSYRKNLAKFKEEGIKVGNKRVLKVYNTYKSLQNDTHHT